MNNLLVARRSVIVGTSTLHFHVPKQNQLWLVGLHVSQMACWLVLGRRKLLWSPDLGLNKYKDIFIGHN